MVLLTFLKQHVYCLGLFTPFSFENLISSCFSYREPVSKDEAEDYLDIISQPMDLQTMLGKFSQGSYRHCQDFMEDMKRVFSNAEEYNHEGSDVLSCMVKTEQTFVELLQKLLPGLTYLRRRSRKRIRHPPTTSEEDEEEEEEPKKLQNGKAKRRSGRIRRNCRDRGSESEEEEEEEEYGAGRRRSKRTSATSGKDYREQNSDGECDTRGRRRRGRRKALEESSEEEGSAQHRSSRRRKH